MLASAALAGVVVNMTPLAAKPTAAIPENMIRPTLLRTVDLPVEYCID